MRYRLWFAGLAGLMVGCGQEAPKPASAVESAKAPAPVALAEPAPKAEPQLVAVTLPAGTVLQVRTATALSTKLNKAGESFSATLAQPLIAGGKTIAAKGASVQGVIATSDHGGRVKGRANLALRLASVQTAAGPVKISTNAFNRQAPGTKKRDAAKIGSGAGIGAAIGALAGGGAGAAIGAAAGGGAGTGVVLATRGAPAVIGSESLISFRLRAPVTVTLPAH